MAKQATANNIEVAPPVNQEVTTIQKTVKNLELTSNVGNKR
jgi:hypothetical protein